MGIKRVRIQHPLSMARSAVVPVVSSAALPPAARLVTLPPVARAAAHHPVIKNRARIRIRPVLTKKPGKDTSMGEGGSGSQAGFGA